MKCSECSRHNSDANTFCIYCGTALKPKQPASHQSTQKIKVILPPQDIDELIYERPAAALSSPRHLAVHPALVVSLAIILGLSGVYYWWFYRDDVRILAIDYQNTQLINE